MLGEEVLGGVFGDISDALATFPQVLLQDQVVYRGHGIMTVACYISLGLLFVNRLVIVNL